MKDVLAQLKFVQNAVEAKSPVFETTHFLIENGHVRATNSIMTIGAPLDTDLNCAPQAATLVKAVSSCKDVLSLSMTDGGRMRVSSGRFKAFVPCAEAERCDFFPKPSGMAVEVNGKKLMAALTRLQPFVATDGLRPWVNGVLLRGQSAFATNNICLVEAWLGVELPFTANVPLAALKVVTASSEIPSRILMDNNSITFLYDSGRWVKTQLLATDWPSLDSILAVDNKPREIPPELFTAAATVSKFSEDGTVHFRAGSVHSSRQQGVGASFEVMDLPAEGAYKNDALQLLDGVATHADFDRYPQPAIFYGKDLRGALLGIQQ